MRNIALRLCYDGTAYHGWQAQKNAATVSQTIEAALSAAMEHTAHLTGCGRTDAGVHARTYVANFYTDSRIPIDRVPYAVNYRLPRDIAILSAVEVGADFHSTFSATGKEYTYQIYNAPIHNPFYVNYAHFYPQRINLDAMRDAARHMVGVHDFAALRSVGSNVKTTVREMRYIDVAQSGELITIRMCASGFLYNMARAIAGTLIYASEGKLAPTDIPTLLAKGERTAAGPTMPACGLYMTGVWYNENI